MNIFVQYSLFIFYFFILTNTIYSQHIIEDSSIRHYAARQAIEQYNQQLGSQLHIYNGVEYVLETDGFIRGHPYFQSDVVEEGTITYDGVTYFSVPLLYNINKDYVIVEHENNSQRIKLHNDKIKNFNLSNHQFVFIQADTLKSSTIRTGFYDQLYIGNIALFAKRTKIAQQATRGVTKEYLAKNSYYISKDHSYHPVKNKSSVLKLFRDQKKDLQKYIRDNKINFRQDPEHALIKLVAQYDRLANSL